MVRRSLVVFFVLVVALGILAVSFAFADGPVASTSSDNATTVSVPRDPDAVLYDQMDNPGSSAAGSQRFPDFADRFMQSADDFVIPANTYWQIDMVEVNGQYTTDVQTPTWEVYFYADSAGLPGTEVYSATALTGVDSSGDVSVTLTSPAVLGEGAYWVSVMAYMNFVPDGQWFWNQRTITNTNPFAFRDPTGLTGNPCVDWGYGGSDCDVGSYPDLNFRLSGTVVEPNLTFEKTVGFDPGTCATADSISVPAGGGGTEVTYCYTLDNTGTMPLAYHTVTDSELGTLLGPGFMAPVGPGDGYYFTYTVNITQTTVNDAVWAISNAAGAPIIEASDTATVTVEAPTGVALSGFTAETTNLLLPMAFVALVVTILGTGVLLQKKSRA
jgi:hypothetical protein